MERDFGQCGDKSVVVGEYRVVEADVGVIPGVGGRFSSRY